MRKLTAFLQADNGAHGKAYWMRVLWFSFFFSYDPSIAKLLNQPYWYYIDFKVIPYARWQR